MNLIYFKEEIKCKLEKVVMFNLFCLTWYFRLVTLIKEA